MDMIKMGIIKQTICKLVLSATTALSGCSGPSQQINSYDNSESRALEKDKRDFLEYSKRIITAQANSNEEYSLEVKEELEETIQKMNRAQFYKYLKLTDNLYSKNFIVNPQRYSMRTLETLNKLPLEDLEKPTILFIMGKYDHNLLGIHPLEQKTSKIDDLLDKYRVVLYEVNGKQEFKAAMDRFSRDEMLREEEAIAKGKKKGEVAGLVFGAHGDRYSIMGNKQEDYNEKHEDAVILIHWTDLIKIIPQYDKLFDKDAIVLFASCNAGEGKNDELNLANTAAYSLPGRKVFSCDSKLLDFDFEKEDDGSLNPSSLKLYSVSRHIESSDCTYVAKCKDEKECFDEFIETSGISKRSRIDDLLKTDIKIPLHFLNQISYYPNPYQIVRNFAVRGVTNLEDMENYLQLIQTDDSVENIQKKLEIMMRSLEVGFKNLNCVESIVYNFEDQIDPDPRKLTKDQVKDRFGDFDVICEDKIQ